MVLQKLYYVVTNIKLMLVFKMQCMKCLTFDKIIQSKLCGQRMICMACGQALPKNKLLKYNKERGYLNE
jgi:hypothetical protein